MTDLLEVLDNTSEVEEDDAAVELKKYLTFLIGDDPYGFYIDYVVEIIGAQEVTEIPEQLNYVKGVINLRGKIIPVMDVRLRFRKEERPYDERTCFVVVNIKGLLVGLIVDTVLEVMEINEEKVSSPPGFEVDFSSQFISGVVEVRNSVILLLDTEKLVYEESIEEVQVDLG